MMTGIDRIRWRSTCCLAAVVALISMALYLPALQNGFVNWDDPLYVYDNDHIRSLGWESIRWALTDASRVYWHPLAWLSHALDRALWGLNPLGHHLTSIVLHALNSFLVVCLVTRLLEMTRESGQGMRCRDSEILTAGGIAGVLFAMHPLHVESVVWISERKDLLYALFFLLSIMSYMRYASDPEGAGMFYRNRRYWITAGLFTLSLAGKPMAVTLPAVLLLLDWYPLGRFAPGKRIFPLLVEKLPFLLLSALVAVITLIAQQGVGAMPDLELLPVASRVLVAFRALCLYLWKTIFPVNLLPLYPYPQQVSLAMPEYLVAIPVVLGITLLSLALARKQAAWAVAWGYFVVTLFPVLGFMQSGYQFMADRFMYLPILGPFILMGVGSARVLAGTDASPAMKRIAVVVAVALGVLLAGATIRQIPVWRTSLTLWDTIIDKEPGRIHFAYHNRGVAYLEQGEFARAIEDSTRAIAMKPDFEDAWHNRGLAYARLGEQRLAIADYTKAVTLAPGMANAYVDRGRAYASLGEKERALADYGKALLLEPENLEALNNRGLLYAEAGEFDLAIADYARTVSIRSDYVYGYINRGLAYAGQGKPDQAIREYDKALSLKPPPALAGRALSNRGIAFYGKGDFNRALQDFTDAIGLEPGNFAGHANRGAVFRALRRYGEAIEDYGRALALKPDFTAAYLERGDLYMTSGRADRAVNDYKAACELGSRDGCRKALSGGR